MSDEAAEIAAREKIARYIDTSPRWKRTWQRIDSIAYPILTLVALIFIWHGLVVAFNVSPILVPKPTSVFHSLYANWGTIWRACLPTLQEIGLGFALSVAIGIPLAVLIVSSRALEKTIYPILVISQAIPKVALAPLFLVWFGFGTTPKALFTFLICFFPIVIDTAVGLNSVPREMTDLGRSMGASRFAIFRRIRLPHSLPNIFAGLKLAMTLAVVGAIIAELSGSQKGLGHELQIAQGFLDASLLFALVFVSAVIGIVTYLLVELAERLTVPWHISARRHQ